MAQLVTAKAPYMTLGPDDKAFVVGKLFVSVGDSVRADQVIAELETSKCYVDVRVPVSGTVEAMLVQVGDLVPCGAPVATIRCVP